MEGFDGESPVNCSTSSVYEIIRSWVLQDQSEKPVSYYYGMQLFRKIENVRMLDRYNSKEPLLGTLYLTATHLIFVEPGSKKETWVLHNHIANVEKLPLSTSGSSLIIRFKTFLSVTFIIPRERECQDVHVTLSQLCRPVSIEDLYCFHYTSSTEDLPKHAGWTFFDFQSEFQRMRVPNDLWTLTLLNQNYDLCDTYPRYLFVPSAATSQILLGSSRFRSKGRLPVLSYLHENKAAICRCSQPLSGFSARCVEDEKLLEEILNTNPNYRYMYVVDTRPRINAMANRATGKGYENENFYENIKFHFLGIENIHVMRSSLSKLLETCELTTPSMHDFLSGLESSGWLKHIRAVLDTSQFIAQAVDSGVSVVVHCSDGWDRTAQVCSLASLLLDPHYRTVQGYQALIEKDWLAFGHKFSDRLGHVAGDQKELSPVFTQFIEATWQLTVMFPTAFQFNERFLLVIHDHTTSCQYGTFVGNCEKDRVDLRLKERTFSLWGYMANHMSEYLNPLYDANAETGLLVPSPLPQVLKFWRGMYCRFESGVHPREPLGDILLALCDHSLSMQDHISLLQSRIACLKKLLVDHSNTFETDKEVCEVIHPFTDISQDSPTLDNRDGDEERNKEALTQHLEVLHIKPDKEPPTRQRLETEIKSVALDWKVLRNITECSCSASFDNFSRKQHCWRCGGVFCPRCIDKLTPLPGHGTKRPVPVCQNCYSILRSSDSP